eukprot:SM000245S08181  [mRNA]  locus=s245:156576:164108:+ [translate_table: standard]
MRRVAAVCGNWPKPGAHNGAAWRRRPITAAITAELAVACRLPGSDLAPWLPRSPARLSRRVHSGEHRLDTAAFGSLLPAAADAASKVGTPPPFSKVLVANRGEIACRIMRTARRLGIKSVAVYSDVDRAMPHVHMADEAVCLGPAPAVQSYLNVDRLVAAVQSTGAQAVHPGYGFLSENASFVEDLEAMGVAFVGPSASAIAAMGDKIESKRLALEAGVSTIPGSAEVLTDPDHAVQIAKMVGFPIMLKASAGGGGKGMRVARFIDRPRHIEIQLVGDAHGHVVYLPERECSIQRRNQKVVEEAPSTFLPPDIRKAMGEQAVLLAKAVGYKSAGTVEFLMDKDRNFFFLEMNTRLQVEHPVTELVTGLDIVEIMFKVAAGERLQLSQEEAAVPRGWALECRVYAEDPCRNFLLTQGRLQTYMEPTSETPDEIVRVDSGIREGCSVSIHYDSLLSKLITWGPARESAIASMERALDSYVIHGLNHNASFLRSVVSLQDFKAGNLSTKFLDEHFPDGWKSSGLSPKQKDEVIAIATLLRVTLMHTKGLKLPSQQELLQLVISIAGEDVTVTVQAGENLYSPQLEVEIGGRHYKVRESVKQLKGRPSLVVVAINGKEATCQMLKRLPRGFRLLYEGAEIDVLVQTPLQANLSKHMPPPPVTDYSKVLHSPMPGYLVKISAEVGQEVMQGDELAVVEAMKMRNVLRSEQAGIVKRVCVETGCILSIDQVILEFE